MNPPTIATLVVAFLALLWFIGTYNGLVRTRNHCDEAWSMIETELKRRHDLIPNLVETVKGYAAHERAVLERVVAARSQAVSAHVSPRAQATDENALIGGLRQLFAVAEGYPDLKADRNFLHLQEELVNTEDRIQSSRRFYNANVRDLNNRVQTFPSSLLASGFGFEEKEFFEIDDASVRAVPSVDV